jgi:hypothetical protein
LEIATNYGDPQYEISSTFCHSIPLTVPTEKVKNSNVRYTTRQHPNTPHYNSECGESMFLRNVRIQRLHGSTTHKTAMQTSSILVYNMQLKSERSQSFINYQHVRDSHFVNFHLPKRCIIFKDLTIRK